MQKISRDECRQRFPGLPESIYDPVSGDEIHRFPQTVVNTVFLLEASSFSGLALKLGKALAAAMARLEVGSLIFMGDSEIPWRRREVSYPPARRGLQFLESKGIGRRFNGGLEFGFDELPEAMRHMLWLIRTNAVLPYVWFTDSAQKFIASPCQYGGLHLSVVAGQDVDSILKAFSDNGFFQVDTASCSERFAKAGIRGRTISV